MEANAWLSRSSAFVPLLRHSSPNTLGTGLAHHQPAQAGNSRQKSRKFICYSCPFETNLKNEIKLHRKSHKGEQRLLGSGLLEFTFLGFFAPFCDVSVNNDGLYGCSFCGKRFRARGFLRMHLQKVHGSKSSIDEISKAFIQGVVEERREDRYGRASLCEIEFFWRT